MSDAPIWFITGCSTGFGRALAALLLEQGKRVAVTARNPADIQDLVDGRGDTALALRLDVTKPDDVSAAAAAALAHFGRVDVLVNNAGIGYFAAVEESEEEAVRRMFEINFWGLAAMTDALLPAMRERRSGHIVNISSIGGLMGFPALGYYNASKFAVEGLSEALAMEVKPLGIGVTIVEPSGFRTDWAGRSASDNAHLIADYAKTAGRNNDSLRANSGNQAGDPRKAAEAIVRAVEAETPPLRLLLGEAAMKGARVKIKMLEHDFDAWEETTVGADAPKEESAV